MAAVKGPGHRSVRHVPSDMLANDHYADQLVERLGWELADAGQQERAIRA
jgi:hypothetical protein